MPRRTHDDSLETKKNILASAQRLFTRRGFSYENISEALSNYKKMSLSCFLVWNKLHKKMYNLLKKVFPICSTFTSNIPTYPGGYWAWAFCSEEVEPLSYWDERRGEAITKTCKIYNEEYHNARFALPNYLKELL